MERETKRENRDDEIANDRFSGRRRTSDGVSLTWDSYISALGSFKNQPAGLYPSVTYTPDDHSGVAQSSMYQVQNSKFVQVLPMTDIPRPSLS